MLKLTLGSMCVAVALLGTGAITTGCSDAASSGEAARTGTLSAALTTTGSDGATYTFPVGTYISLQSNTSGEYVALDGTDTILTKKEPVGTYTATLYYSGSGVVLERTKAGVTTTVDATWTNPQPVTIDIVNQQTTAIVLHFSVQGLADLTFETGTVQISADVVSNDVSQANHAAEAGTVNFNQEDYADAAASYATALDVDTGVDYAEGLQFQGSGDWVQYGSTTLCKYGSITAAQPSGTDGLSLRLAEVVGGNGYLCVYDYGANDYINFGGSAYGAAPAAQASFLPGTNYQFYVSVAGYVGDVFDGTTLKQTALALPVALTSPYFSHYIYDSSSTLLTQVSGSLNATVQLLP